MATSAPETARAAESPGSEESGFRYVLAQPSFRLIWLAQVAAQLADKFLMFSLIILAYHLSGSSLSVASSLLAYTLPSVFIAPAAGVLADRYDRKLIMVATNFGRALLVALIPLSASLPPLEGKFWPLLVIVFVFAAVGQLFGPAEAAAIPSVLSRPSLIAANSMVLLTMVLTLVVGGGLAPIVSGYQLYDPYWIAVVLFAVAGVLIMLTRIPQTHASRGDMHHHPFHQMVLQLKEGMAYLASSPVLLFSFVQFAIAILVVFMIFTLAPAYVARVLHVVPQASYLILGPAMVGAIVSAAFIGRFGTKAGKSTLLLVGLVTCGVTLFALANVPLALQHLSALRDHTVWSGAVFSFLLGLEFGTMMIPAVTYLMEATEDQLRGRVFSLLFMVVNGATALPVLVAAGLADTVGTDNVIAGAGVLLVATGVVAWLLARRVLDPSER